MTGMTGHSSRKGLTPLEQWKALAKIENRRAKQHWDATGIKYVPPKSVVDPDGKKARAERDAKIEAWSMEGMSTRDIASLTGLNVSTVNKIVRTRMRAADEVRADDDQGRPDCS